MGELQRRKEAGGIGALMKCEHCRNPIKEFWSTQCMWRGNTVTPDVEEPPCQEDERYSLMEARAKADILMAKCSIMLMVLLIVGLGIFFA